MIVTCSYAQSDLQIRTADTNVDDGLDLLAGVTLPLTTPHLLGELLHVLQHGVDTLHDILAVDLHRLVGHIAQGDVVDGAVLGEVDGLALEHVIAELLQTGLLGELDQEGQGLFGDEVLGEVEEDLRLVRRVEEGAAELLEALGVLLEGLLQDDVTAHRVVVLLEGLPRVEVGGLREPRHCDGLKGIRRLRKRCGWLDQCGADRGA